MSWHLRSEGPQLTAFNPANGTRLSFGPTPARLHAPELLDVKLTDVCSVGCAFCYQDSRPDRQHARLEDVAFIAAEAGKAGVFEVALGGGEVSEYPHFRKVLHLFRAAGVVPNFTTRRMRWLAREWPELGELVGGVAVSVGSAAEIRLLSSLIPTSERRAGQLVAQVVMGTVERPELLALMQEAGAAGIRVTLLSFKDVGRGQTFRPLPYDWWLSDLPQYVAHTQVSIDTALAAECPTELEKLLLPGSYHTEEGRFSAYADAVSMSLAPSSYHTGPVYPFDADWLKHFAAPDFVQGLVTPPAPGRVRLGFATNSSSSHSLVLFRDEAVLERLSESERDSLFTTKELKEKYLAVKALASIPKDTPVELVEYLLEEIGLMDYKEVALEAISGEYDGYFDISDLLESYGAPESYTIENDSQSYFGLQLSQENLTAFQAFRKLLMRSDMGVRRGWDSAEVSYQDHSSEDIVSVLQIYDIGGKLKSRSLQILTHIQDLDSPFIDRVIDVVGQIYGEVYADNLRELARDGFSVADISAVASGTFGNYIYPEETEVLNKIDKYLLPLKYRGHDLRDILDIRLRMTSDEFSKFATAYQDRYGGKKDVPWFSCDFPDKQSDFTAEEMMGLIRKS